MPFAESAHKAKAKMDVLALINQNYLLTRAGLWEHHSCNGYISKRLKGLASVELTDCGQFIMWSEGTIPYLYYIFKSIVHICLCMYVHVCLFYGLLARNTLHDKMDNRMMPSVVHYEAHAKCVFLNPKSILYSMLFTEVAHPMGLNCCCINVAFKTFSQFESSFHYCHITKFMITEQDSQPQLRPCPFSWQAAMSTAI